MRSIGKMEYDFLFRDANISPRKRAHFNLHSSFEDKVQRLLIAMSRGSFVEPHFHTLPHQWEMFIVLKGVVKVILYKADGSVLKEIKIGSGQEVNIIEFLPNEIHSVECMSDKALLLEIKEGPFDPLYAKEMSSFIN